MIKKIFKDLFKIPRCLASEGNRTTLKKLEKICGKIQLIKFKSGQKFGGWIVPNEWKVIKASLKDTNGKNYINYFDNNLQVMVNSTSFKGKLPLSKLKNKIHTIKDMPSATPYVTNYYGKDWAFCLPYNIYKKLPDCNYQVEIKAENKKGYMDIGQVFFKGKSRKEFIFTSNICHPQMANNELSGPIVQTLLIKDLKKLFRFKTNYYSYRFLFLPETIGSIAYIHKNINQLKKNCIGGFVLTCLGKNKKFKIIDTPIQNNYSIKLLKSALQLNKFEFDLVSFNERGSDERQFCSPNVNLPFTSLVNEKYGEYKEYHTSLDNIDFIDELAIQNSVNVLSSLIELAETNCKPFLKCLGEPKLDKFDIYPKKNTKLTRKSVKNLMNFLSYCNRNNDLIDICTLAEIELSEGIEIFRNLLDNTILNEKKI